MSDIYIYTPKGYKPVEPDWDDPTPLWVMIVEVLREFPRTIDTIQYGIETIYGEIPPPEIIGAELCKLATSNFVAMTDSSAEPLVGYKLTRWGLILQGGDSELCPYIECQTELVIDGDGWRQCGACERVFYSRVSDTDETVYHLYTGKTVLSIFGRRIPEMPKEMIICPPVPQCDMNPQSTTYRTLVDSGVEKEVG